MCIQVAVVCHATFQKSSILHNQKLVCSSFFFVFCGVVCLFAFYYGLYSSYNDMNIHSTPSEIRKSSKLPQPMHFLSCFEVEFCYLHGKRLNASVLYWKKLCVCTILSVKCAKILWQKKIKIILHKMMIMIA